MHLALRYSTNQCNTYHAYSPHRSIGAYAHTPYIHTQHTNLQPHYLSFKESTLLKQFVPGSNVSAHCFWMDGFFACNPKHHNISMQASLLLRGKQSNHPPEMNSAWPPLFRDQINGQICFPACMILYVCTLSHLATDLTSSLLTTLHARRDPYHRKYCYGGEQFLCMVTTRSHQIAYMREGLVWVCLSQTLDILIRWGFIKNAWRGVIDPQTHTLLSLLGSSSVDLQAPNPSPVNYNSF